MSETIQQPVTDMVTEAKETTAQPSETFFARLVGINEAASITGRNKGQISRDTTAKRLPYVLNEKGLKRYKVADLFQHYGFKQPEDTAKKEVQQQAENSVETIRTAVELAVLKERVSRLEDENRDLRYTRDKHLDTIQRLTLLLPAPPTAAPEPVISPAERKSFWKRLFP